MRSAKHPHNWNLDDERRKRSVFSSIQPTRTFAKNNDNNNSSANYTHEKKHTGILF
jgi:hypothetical protein